MSRARPRAVLLLESGLRLEGYAFGGQGECAGEVVFNTSLTGYQEILTDPSYAGQIVTLTNPLIGNYGTRELDQQADGPRARALVIRELSGVDSNFASEEALDRYLARHGVVGLEGVDTRGLVLHLRQAGTMNGIISTEDVDEDSLRTKLAAVPSMQGLDLVREVTLERARPFEPREGLPRLRAGAALHVVAYDFGIKRNILELMSSRNLDITLVPATTTAEEVLALKPDGVFCSNGPGDPAAVTYAIEALRGLIGRVPLFGICLGHQLLALALGARTYKLKFGHRGGNHPVRDESTARIEITAQNHGFCVEAATLPEGAEPTHWNLNDRTLEGFRHGALRLFCVQYHPEASPGPHDSGYLFDRFRRLMEGEEE